MEEQKESIYGRLARERLAGARREDQKLPPREEKKGKKGAKHNHRAQEVTEKKSSPEAKAEKPAAQEVRHDKNRSELEARNEKIRRERREISASVDSALRMVSSALKQPNLSERERRRLAWVEKTVLNAKKQTNFDNGKDTYKVDLDGKLGREEGIPIDELRGVVWDMERRTQAAIREVQQSKANKRESQRVKDVYETASARETLSTEEWKHKLAWYDVLNNLPTGNNLREQAFGLVQRWENADRDIAAREGKKFSGYDSEHKKQQLGEALKQVVEKSLKVDESKLREALESRQKDLGRYQKLIDAFDRSSVPYFNFHFKNKDAKNLTEQDKKDQHPYTEREANLIANDGDYRKMLVEKFGAAKKLPKEFEQMDELQQDYELAMLALNYRRVLVLPKEETEQAPAPRPAPLPVDGRPVSKDELERVGALGKPTTLGDKELSGSSDVPKLVDVVKKVPPDIKPTQETEKKPEKLYIVDISEIAKRMAWTQTEERIQKEYKEMGRFKRAFKGLTEDKRRVEYYQEALNRIKTDNNLMAAIEQRVSGKEGTGQKIPISPEYLALLDGAVKEYEKDLVDSQREMGETITDDPRIKSAVSEMLIAYATDGWNKMSGDIKSLSGREALELYVKEKIIPLLEGKQWSKDPHQQSERKGLLYASNFYNLAEAWKGKILDQSEKAAKEFGKEKSAEIEKAIKSHLNGVLNIELQLGYKERDLVNNRPKDVLKWYEKMVQWSEGDGAKKVVGRIMLNPFVVGAVTVGASRVAQRALKWGVVGGAAALGAAGFWVPIGAGAVIGGAFRAAKRSKDVSYDQAQELRQQTLGGEASEVLGEKGELGYGKAIMEFEKAQKIVDDLSKKDKLSPEEKQQLAEIYARLELEREMLRSDNKKYPKVDLFKLSKAQGDSAASTTAAKSALKVALAELGFSEKMLRDPKMENVRGYISNEKNKLSELIEAANKKQDSFRRKEMWKAFGYGAAMGLAGGIVAHELGEGVKEARHLISEAYKNSHELSLAGLGQAFRSTDLYHSMFGGSGGSHIEHLEGSGSHAATSSEYLNFVRGHVDGGGQVEMVRTQSWYDNNDPTESAAEHIHNANELKFFINKDSVGQLHLKVPVEQGGSWQWHGQSYTEADINKAFAEGHIKMVFVPDSLGGGPHEGITFEIDPQTKEIIIPPDSNVRNLFDENGVFKGKGYFGLAEQVGQKDGNTMLRWINSMRGNGKEIDYGTSANPTDVIPNSPSVPAPDGIDYTIPTVPLTRKVWDRPAEKEKKLQEKKKKEQEKAKKQAEKDKKKAEKQAKKHKGHSADHGGGHGSGAGGGGEVHGEADGGKKKETTPEAPKAPEFKGDVLKRYTNQKYAKELLRNYSKNKEKLGKSGLDVDKVEIVSEGKKQDSMQRVIKKDLAKAVWELEQALLNAKIITQEGADEFYEEEAIEKPVADKGNKTENTKKGGETESDGDVDAAPEKRKQTVVEKLDPEVIASAKLLKEKYPVIKRINFPKVDDKILSFEEQKKRINTLDEILGRLNMEGKQADKTFEINFVAGGEQKTNSKIGKITFPENYKPNAVEAELKKVFERAESSKKKE